MCTSHFNLSKHLTQAQTHRPPLSVLHLQVLTTTLLMGYHNIDESEVSVPSHSKQTSTYLFPNTSTLFLIFSSYTSPLSYRATQFEDMKEKIRKGGGVAVLVKEELKVR